MKSTLPPPFSLSPLDASNMNSESPRLRAAVACALTLGLLGTTACPAPTFTEEQRPLSQDFAAPSCERLEGNVESDDATKAEGILSVGYSADQHASTIALVAHGREGEVVGTGSATFQVPLSLKDPIVTISEFTDDGGTAREVTESFVLGAFAQHTTVSEMGDTQTYLWWTQGADGFVLDATVGILTTDPVDQESVFALPAGNTAILQYVKDGEVIADASAIDAFVTAYGIDALEDQQTFRRLHAVFKDNGWRAGIVSDVAVCNGAVAELLAGPVNCAKDDPFSKIPTIHCALGAVAGGLSIAGGLIAAGVITTAAGGLAAAAVIAVVIYVVGNHIGAAVDNNRGDIVRGGGILLESFGAVPKDSYKEAGDFFDKGGSSTGDPHLTTLDGTAYDFQSAGEFVLVRSATGDFEVQTRQVPLSDNRCGGIAVNSHVAMRVGDVLIEYGDGDRDTIVVDGTRLTPLSVPLEIGEGVFAVTAERGGVVVKSPTGEMVYLSTGGAVSVTVLVSAERAGTYEGLLGNANGDQDDDLIGTDGPLDLPPTFEDLHRSVASHWAVDDETSLFTYVDGENSATYRDLAFPASPANLDGIPEAEVVAAEAACASIDNAIARQDCVFDVACTGDDAFVEDHEVRDPDARIDPINPIDFFGWTEAGDDGAGNWEVNEDGSGVVQTLNGSPTFLLSPDNYFDARIDGTLRTGDGGDDDIIGFVFGYDSAAATTPTAMKSYVLLWKGRTQGGSVEGLRLLYVDGDYRNDLDADADTFFWDVTDPRVTIVGEDTGEDTGWRRRDHRFSLLYTADKIEIWIDGVKRIDVDAASLPQTPAPGRFGFFNYSQPQTEYRDFRVGPPTEDPGRQDCVFRLSGFDDRVLDDEVTWGAVCTRYEVSENIEIRNGGAATIVPGTQLSMANDTEILVLSGGTLTADGTEEEPVEIRGITDESGTWTGVIFSDGSTGNTLRHVNISNAGAPNDGIFINRSVHIRDGASVALEDVRIDKSQSQGVRVEIGGTLAAFERVAIETDVDAPLSLPIGQIDTIGDGNAFGTVSAEAHIELSVDSTVTDGRVERLLTLRDLGVPYLTRKPSLPDDLLVTGALGRLQVEAGVELRIGGGRALLVRDQGAVNATGTSASSVLFRGEDEGAGAFIGLVFESATQSTLNFVTVQDGGAAFGTPQAAIVVGGLSTSPGNLLLEDSRIVNSEAAGIGVATGGILVEARNAFEGNAGDDIVFE